MAAVEVSFTPLPTHVRTARLIAAAVARRNGIDGPLLDEIRLAVGEACSRAVAVHQRQAPTHPVTLTIYDDQDSLVVTVADTAGEEHSPNLSTTEDPFDALTRTSADDGAVLDALPSGFGLAVIAGLVDDLDVVRAATGTVVRMTWKASTRDGGGAATTQPAEESPT